MGKWSSFQHFVSPYVDLISHKFSKSFPHKSHLNFSVCFALQCPKTVCLDLKQFSQISQFNDLPLYFTCEFFLSGWVNFFPAIWTWVDNSLFLAFHIVSLRQNANLSVDSLMAFWLFNSFFDGKVELRRVKEFSVFASLNYFSRSNNMKTGFNKNFKFLPFFLCSSLMSIFFLIFLKLYQGFAVQNCYCSESKFT